MQLSDEGEGVPRKGREIAARSGVKLGQSEREREKKFFNKEKEKAKKKTNLMEEYRRKLMPAQGSGWRSMQSRNASECGITTRGPQNGKERKEEKNSEKSNELVVLKPRELFSSEKF